MVYSAKKTIVFTSLWASSLFLSQTIEAKENDKPNIIFIMADDLGIGDLGCYGQRQIKTPNIDNLAKTGIKFTQHYSGSTVCAPSRSSLMTGKHTGHTPIRGNKDYRASDNRVYDQGIPHNEITVASILQNNGYNTACIGKWGLGGYKSQSTPNKMGFDYFFGYLGQANAHSYYPDFLFENEKKLELNNEKYSHDLIMEKAKDFLRQDHKEPFFLYLAPTIPHASLDIPEEWMNEYKGKFFETPYINNSERGYVTQETPRAAFAAMVSRLDYDIQNIIGILDKKGIRDNTIIIFTSDNGTHWEGGHDPNFFDSNGPFRGSKRDLYDGGIKTPFIVNWPNKITQNSTSFHKSAFWDFLPTICNIINVAPPKNSDGISYLPTLTKEGEQKKHDYLYFEFHEQGGKQAVLKDGWKLIRLNINKPEQERYELFNIQNDPSEIANVIDQHPEMKIELKKIMDNAHEKSDIWEFEFEK